MSVVVITPPVPAIDLDLVKIHLRVDDDDSDDLIQALVDAAVAHIDGPAGHLGVCFWSQTLEMRLDEFSTPIRLLYGPVTDIVSVKSVDGDGAEQTMSSDDYVLRNDGYLDLAYGASWPSVRGDVEGVRIQYEAGFETLPGAVLPAVHLLVGHWYANREAVGPGDMKEVPMAVDALLRPYRMVQV